jgi:hypothetical protein
MLSFYRCLLYLYPPLYRREFKDEMVSVFRAAHADISAASLRDRISFRIRESLGLLAGAVREHVRIINLSDQLISFRRFTMRPEFRFPRSTVVLMLVIFAGVILAMEKANTVQVAYAAGADSIWPSTPWFFTRTPLSMRRSRGSLGNSVCLRTNWISSPGKHSAQLKQCGLIISPIRAIHSLLEAFCRWPELSLAEFTETVFLIAAKL